MSLHHSKASILHQSSAGIPFLIIILVRKIVHRLVTKAEAIQMPEEKLLVAPAVMVNHKRKTRD